MTTLDHFRTNEAGSSQGAKKKQRQYREAAARECLPTFSATFVGKPERLPVAAICRTHKNNHGDVGRSAKRLGMSFKLGALVAGFAILPGPVHAQSTLPVAPPAPALDERGVDLLSGTFQLEDPGVAIGASDSGGLRSVRRWVGGSNSTGGWANNYEYFLVAPYRPTMNLLNSYITVNLGERSLTFSGVYTNINGTYTWGAPYSPIDGNGETLSDDLATFTDRDGTIVKFGPSTQQTQQNAPPAFATAVIKPNGERLTFVHNSNNVVQSVQTNFGYQIKFEYPPGRIDISKATAINDAVEYCSSSAVSCAGLVNAWPTETYSRPNPWQTNNYTETVTDPTGNTRSFTIGVPSNATSPAMLSRVPGPPGTSAISYSYAQLPAAPYTTPSINVISSVSDVSGLWSYATNRQWVNSTSMSQLNPYQISVTSPSSATETYTVAWEGQLPSIIQSVNDGLGRTTNYQYDALSRLTYAVPPEGAITSGTPSAGYTRNTYDGRGNVVQVTKVPKAGSGLASIVYQAGYDATCTNPVKCNKPNWLRDANSNETDYSYDPNHGGILSEMKPAPSAGSARPLVLTSWTQIYGRVTAPGNSLVQSPYPIWRVATTTECQTVAGSSTAVCDASAPQTVTTFQYGASGTRFALLVKGRAVTSGGVTLRTCYNYDIYGNRISETTPNAGLGVCP